MPKTNLHEVEGLLEVGEEVIGVEGVAPVFAELLDCVRRVAAADRSARLRKIVSKPLVDAVPGQVFFAVKDVRPHVAVASQRLFHRGQPGGRTRVGATTQRPAEHAAAAGGGARQGEQLGASPPGESPNLTSPFFGGAAGGRDPSTAGAFARDTATGWVPGQQPQGPGRHTGAGQEIVQSAFELHSVGAKGTASHAPLRQTARSSDSGLGAAQRGADSHLLSPHLTTAQRSWRRLSSAASIAYGSPAQPHRFPQQP